MRAKGRLSKRTWKTVVASIAALVSCALCSPAVAQYEGQVDVEAVVTTVTVLGYVDAMNAETGGSVYSSGNLLLMNLDYLQTIFGEDAVLTSRIYLDLVPELNHTVYATTLNASYPGRFDAIIDAQRYFDETIGSEGTHVVYGFFSVGTILSFLLLGMGNVERPVVKS